MAPRRRWGENPACSLGSRLRSSAVHLAHTSRQVARGLQPHLISAVISWSPERLRTLRRTLMWSLQVSARSGPLGPQLAYQFLHLRELDLSSPRWKSLSALRSSSPSALRGGGQGKRVFGLRPPTPTPSGGRQVAARRGRGCCSSILFPLDVFPELQGALRSRRPRLGFPRCFGKCGVLLGKQFSFFFLPPPRPAL